MTLIFDLFAIILLTPKFDLSLFISDLQKVDVDCLDFLYQYFDLIQNHHLQYLQSFMIFICHRSS